jgi:hypothetical protein
VTLNEHRREVIELDGRVEKVCSSCSRSGLKGRDCHSRLLHSSDCVLSIVVQVLREVFAAYEKHGDDHFGGLRRLASRSC